MNRNHLKIIACISMLIDHAGILLFPGVAALRCIGRIALPIFAFFIGEGCRYTRNRKKYFLTVFLLGLGCQLVYVADSLIEDGRLGFASDAWYLNILLTFSVSIALCFPVADLKKAVSERDVPAVRKYALLTLLGLTLLFGGAYVFRLARAAGGSLALDYGVIGVLLPLGALLFDDKYKKLAAFGGGTLLYCLFTMREMPFVWYSLIAVALLAFYNGKSGSKKLKYAFYIFYPAHLAALYLIALLIR